MKKSKLLAATMAALSISGTFIGCDDSAEESKRMYVAYGSPITPPYIGEPEYNPEHDVLEDVYGPPVSEEVEESDLKEDYEPEKDEMVCVYGPPSYFEHEEEEN